MSPRDRVGLDKKTCAVVIVCVRGCVRGVCEWCCQYRVWRDLDIYFFALTCILLTLHGYTGINRVGCCWEHG